MPSEILAIGFAFVFIVGFVLGVIGALLMAIQYPRHVFTCPHGQSDWDNCPVCRR